MTDRRIFATACWDYSQEEWELRQVFASKKEAIQHAYGSTQTAVRCNRPMEWWRVIEHRIPLEGEIVWGCGRVPVGDCD